MNTLEAFGAAGGLSGILGLLGAAVGYGKLQQRLRTVERDVDKLSDVAEQVGRIDERTKKTDDNVRDIKESVRDLTAVLLDDASGRHRDALIRRAHNG